MGAAEGLAREEAQAHSRPREHKEERNSSWLLDEGWTEVGRLPGAGGIDVEASSSTSGAAAGSAGACYPSTRGVVRASDGFATRRTNRRCGWESRGIRLLDDAKWEATAAASLVT